MRALVAPQVDPLARHLDRRDERLDERAVLADDREHRAVVVGVGVHVEHAARAPRARRRSRRSSPGRGPRRSSAPTRAAARSYSRARDPAAIHLPLARLARARPARLPRLRRGRASARVAPVLAPLAGQRAYLFGQAPGIQEGLERRPWRGRAGQTLRRWLELDEDALLRDVPLRLGDALLSRPRRVRARRPHADARGAAALRVLARARAGDHPAAAHRHRRRPRGAHPARPEERHRAEAVGTRYRARRTGRRRDPASAPVRGEQLAQPAPRTGPASRRPRSSSARSFAASSPLRSLDG